MKKFSTINMSPEERLKTMGNVLGAFGNENIRGHHIKYFEDQLIENNENTVKDVTLAPNYYAWLCLMVEHIFWIMRSFCFKQSELDQENLNLLYNNSITKFISIIRELRVFSNPALENLYELSVKVLTIRHAIVHKGFPNLLPVTIEERHLRNKPSFDQDTEKEKLNKTDIKEIIKWYSHPRNFHRIKEEFNLIMQAMSKGPGVSIGF